MLSVKAFLLLFVVSTLVETLNTQLKRGLILLGTPDDQQDLPKYLASPLLTWVYNYSPEPDYTTAKPSVYPYGNLSFVPMLWGSQDSNSFLATIDDGTQFKAILTFNEPDMTTSVGGSDLSITNATLIWNSQIQPLAAKGYQLGSPAVASDTNGTSWLSSFFTQCKNCTISFIAAHYYGTSPGLQSYLSSLHEMYPNLPIWVTEFGFPQVSLEDTVLALNQSIMFMDNVTWIERYAYFGSFRVGQGNGYVGQNGAVWDQNGDITPVGQLWLGLNQTPQVASGTSHLDISICLGILVIVIESIWFLA